jgi:hypothetical protein
MDMVAELAPFPLPMMEVQKGRSKTALSLPTTATKPTDKEVTSMRYDIDPFSTR